MDEKENFLTLLRSRLGKMNIYSFPFILSDLPFSRCETQNSVQKTALGFEPITLFLNFNLQYTNPK
jgi:hypothetical protein